MTFSVELPLPPVGCSPNSESSRHWRERHAARSEYRNAAKVLYLKALSSAAAEKAIPWECVGNTPNFGHVVIHCEWFLGRVLPMDGRYRPKDVSNAIASLKAAVDGFVDARMVKDDTAAYVSWGKTEIHGKKESGKRSCVVVSIEVKE